VNLLPVFKLEQLSIVQLLASAEPLSPKVDLLGWVYCFALTGFFRALRARNGARSVAANFSMGSPSNRVRLEQSRASEWRVFRTDVKARSNE
jgi:hypothetical protein